MVGVKLSRASRMMSLFEGYGEAYGTYDAASAAARELGGKIEIKSTVKLKKEPVTVELWERHLTGTKPLGIIPIRDNDTCLWGCIDIDVYDMDYVEVWETIKKEDLPLIPCRTKSGGLHLFLFTKDPVPAVLMQARLKEMAVLLSHGTAEVFPKQTKVFWNRGDLGSWLNMPYFKGDETTRYGVKPSGLVMSLDEFLEYTADRRIDPDYLENKQFRKKNKKLATSSKGEPEFGDGPPCMQHMANAGFPEGTRNIGLFNLGTFAKKKFGSKWTTVLEDWNRRLMEPPLEASEVVSIVKQQTKKDYQYQCKEHPLSTFCNGSMCRARKFGVGSEDDLPIISGMSILKTEPPLWFIDVGDQRMEMTTEQLQSYTLFHRACMEQLHICYRLMKQETWLFMVGAAMRDAVEIDVPPEAGLPGQFTEILEEFLLNKHRGESQEDLLLGRPFETADPDSGEMYHYFRMKDLRKALDLANFRTYDNGQIVARLRALRCTQRLFNIKNKHSASTWGVPSDIFNVTPELSLPVVETTPI